MTLGLFLAPLKKGTHTVIISGTVSGTAFQATTGLAFEAFTFTYTVNVQ
jgi:hypothetical protein